MIGGTCAVSSAVHVSRLCHSSCKFVPVTGKFVHFESTGQHGTATTLLCNSNTSNHQSRAVAAVPCCPVYLRCTNLHVTGTNLQDEWHKRKTCTADETREAVAVAEQSSRCCAVLPCRFEFVFVWFDIAFFVLATLCVRCCIIYNLILCCHSKKARCVGDDKEGAVSLRCKNVHTSRRSLALTNQIAFRGCPRGS